MGVIGGHDFDRHQLIKGKRNIKSVVIFIIIKTGETLFRQITNKCETVPIYKLKDTRNIFNNITNFT